MDLQKNIFDSVFQSTIDKPVFFSGVGLHSGIRCRVEVYPAKSNHGIVFYNRRDLSKNIVLGIDSVSGENLNTRLHNVDNTFSINTVEHLCSAIHGYGLDNLSIYVDGPEIPILDGSSKAFFEGFVDAGKQHYLGFKKFWCLTSTFEYHDGDRYVIGRPASVGWPVLNIVMDLKYNNPLIDRNGHYSLSLNPDSYQNVYDSRTFCLKEDIQENLDKGLIRGGSLDNALIIEGNSVINTKMRHYNEPARHKTLDFIGDIFVLGHSVIGNFKVHKGGHKLHYEFLKNAFLNNRFELITARDNLSLDNVAESKKLGLAG